MANINKVTLIGRITREIELRYTPKGTGLTEINLAINRSRQDDAGQKIEETTFVDVTLWGRQAELANQYLARGREVYIEGRLQLDTWQDKQSGQKRSKLKVVGENMQFIGVGSQQGGNPQSSKVSTSQLPQQAQSGNSASENPSVSGGSPANIQFEEEDDIPF